MATTSPDNLPTHSLAYQAFAPQQTLAAGIQLMDNTPYHRASQLPPTKYIAPKAVTQHNNLSRCWV